MTTTDQRQRCQAACWAITLIGSLVVTILLVANYRNMAPIRPGTSHKFWYIACNVRLSPEVDSAWGGNAWYVDDNWVAYDETHMHGSDLYCVPTLKVLADFDRVVTQLQEQVESGSENIPLNGYLSWKSSPASMQSPRALVRQMSNATLKHSAERNVEFAAMHGEEDQVFWIRWQRSRWYWFNFVFEWFHLCGLLLFVMWPGIRNASILRWAIHITLAPFLFLLPAYLGYATFSITSAGPNGGILYPFLLLCCRGGTFREWEQYILTFIPQILEPLSPPIGSPMALTGMGMPGPTSALLQGAFCGITVISIHFGYQRWIRPRWSRPES